MAKRCVEKILERMFISLCVIVCMQVPFFILQYMHQLRGHTDELKWQIEQMERSAALTGKNLNQYIAKFIDHSDHDFASQGRVMRAALNRFEKFSQAWIQLKQSSPWTRPFVFLRYVQADLLQATFNEFKMGISFTMESMVFGLMGILLGSGFHELGRAFFKRKKINPPLEVRPSAL